MSKTKISLLVDIDDTLSETALEVFGRIHSKFGHSQTVSELLSTCHQPGNVPEWQSPPILKEIRDLFNDQDFLANLMPVKKSYLLNDLTDNYPLLGYITSRTTKHLKVTELWLKKNKFPRAPILTRAESIKSQDWKINYIMKHHLDIHTFIDNDLACFGNRTDLYRGSLIWLNRYDERPPRTLPRNINMKFNWKDIYDFLIKKT